MTTDLDYHMAQLSGKNILQFMRTENVCTEIAMDLREIKRISVGKNVNYGNNSQLVTVLDCV